MKYFKNTELAKVYSVSEKSVRNWVNAAEQGKLELSLHEERGKKYIANTSRNITVVEELVKKGKKYKNSRGYKIVKPKVDFYKLYNDKQIFDIISSIDIYREIPLQYCYFDGGAERWDQYVKHLMEGTTPNSLTSTIQLVDLNMPYLDTLLEGYTKVNVIDIGVGNGMPVRTILEHLKDKGLLKRYIGIDISKELLDITEKNVKTWFGNNFPFEGHVRDINYERFNDLLVSESLGDDNETTINLVLLLGGTLNNFRQPDHPLNTIHDSMGKKDLLVFTKKLDTIKSRRYFDFTAPGNLAFELVLHLLNIDSSYYTIEQYFDEQKMAREVSAKLTVAISIEFEINGLRKSLELNKNEHILLMRARHQSAFDAIQQFNTNGFDLLETMRSKDGDYFLITSRIKTNQEY